MQKQRWMWIMWPAFMAASVIEMLVFAAFDPLDMLWLSPGDAVSRTGICTMAFFVFWLVLMVAGYVTLMLSMPNTHFNDLGGQQAQKSL